MTFLLKDLIILQFFHLQRFCLLKKQMWWLREAQIPQFLESVKHLENCLSRIICQKISIDIKWKFLVRRFRIYTLWCWREVSTKNFTHRGITQVLNLNTISSSALTSEISEETSTLLSFNFSIFYLLFILLGRNENILFKVIWSVASRILLVFPHNDGVLFFTVPIYLKGLNFADWCVLVRKMEQIFLSRKRVKLWIFSLSLASVE